MHLKSNMVRPFSQKNTDNDDFQGGCWSGSCLGRLRLTASTSTTCHLANLLAHPHCQHRCQHCQHCQHRCHHEWEGTFLARAFTSLPVEAIDLLWRTAVVHHHLYLFRKLQYNIRYCPVQPICTNSGVWLNTLTCWYLFRKFQRFRSR